MVKLKIREMRLKEEAELYSLFYNTVHTVNKIDYSHKQLEVWALKDKNPENWESSFKDKLVYVATDNEKIVGFIDASKEGYIDRLYTHHHYQNQGVASRLVEKLEEVLKNEFGVDHYLVHASITALPFFSNKGYQVVEENIVKRNEIELKNYLMKKEG